MKKHFILLAIVFGFYTTYAQEFTPTAKYSVKNQRSIGDENEGAGLIDVVLSDDALNAVATLDISDIELLDTIELTVLANPGLEDITEILKVELGYSVCCYSVETFYFLVDVNNDSIALPLIENLYCGDSGTERYYIFPTQAKGLENTIVRAELRYTEGYNIEEIKILQSFVWNDDDFDQDAEIAIH